MLAAYHKNAPGNVYNITNDRPLTQLEMFNEIADAVGGVRPTLHLPYLPIYFGAIVAEKVVARATRTKPVVTELGAMMFGSDNKHSVQKARQELGYEPKVDLRDGIKLAAEWFNAGGMSQVSVTQASQNAPLAGATK
jgi:nucleoside-diphosphate-sugar epimerase